MNAPDETAGLPRRQPFAAGDGVTRYPPGSPVVLRIDSPWEKPWKARLPGGAMAPPFPGTAVQFEGELYEVVEAQATGHGAPFLYKLRPWEEDSPPRQVVPYTVEACLRAAEERAAERRRIRVSHVLAWTSPILGLLPADVQRWIERHYNVSASRATLTSGLALLGPSFYAVIRGLALIMSPAPARRGGIPWDDLLPFSSYLMAESLTRLGVAGYANDPLGSLPVSLPWLAVRTVVEAVRGHRKEARKGARPSGDLVREARDEVALLPDGRREVLSLLPKPHWRPSTGILLGDRWHRLEQREEVERAGGRWHRFVLAEAEEAALFKDRVEHRPEEVRELHRQGLLFRKRTWVETFAPLWGLLDAETQRQLAELYGFDAPRQTAWSALGVALLAAYDGVAAWHFLAIRRGGPGDLLMFLAALYLGAESFVRFRRSREGEPAGSLLGWLLRPFARRLLV